MHIQNCLLLGYCNLLMWFNYSTPNKKQRKRLELLPEQPQIFLGP